MVFRTALRSVNFVVVQEMDYEIKLGCRPVAELAILLCCPSWHLCQAVKYPQRLPGCFKEETKDVYTVPEYRHI